MPPLGRRRRERARTMAATVASSPAFFRGSSASGRREILTGGRQTGPEGDGKGSVPALRFRGQYFLLIVFGQFRKTAARKRRPGVICGNLSVRLKYNQASQGLRRLSPRPSKALPDQVDQGAAPQRTAPGGGRNRRDRKGPVWRACSMAAAPRPPKSRTGRGARIAASGR